MVPPLMAARIPGPHLLFMSDSYRWSLSALSYSTSVHISHKVRSSELGLKTYLSDLHYCSPGCGCTLSLHVRNLSKQKYFVKILAAHFPAHRKYQKQCFENLGEKSKIDCVINVSNVIIPEYSSLCRIQHFKSGRRHKLGLWSVSGRAPVQLQVQESPSRSPLHGNQDCDKQTNNCPWILHCARCLHGASTAGSRVGGRGG